MSTGLVVGRCHRVATYTQHQHLVIKARPSRGRRYPGCRRRGRGGENRPGQAHPLSPAKSLTKILQAGHLLQLAIASPHAEYSLLASRRSAQEIDVVSVARPLLPAHFLSREKFRPMAEIPER